MKKRIFYIIILMMILFPVMHIGAETYGNYDPNALVSCGNGLMTKIPKALTTVIRYIYIIIQVVVPVILVIMGSLDLFKGITAQKEDEIKKGQQIFIKRLITGAIIFFVVVIAKFFISIVADSSGSNIIECMDCFLSKKCN